MGNFKSIVTRNVQNYNTRRELEIVLKECMAQNYFKFNNNMYSQKDGVPMGSPLSPLLAEMFMNHLENKVFISENSLIKHVIC